MKWPILSTSLPLTRNLFLRSLLRACARQASLDTGKKLHAIVLTADLAASPCSFLHNALLGVYAACDELSYARKLFDGIPGSHKDAIDWTTLMGCLARCGAPLNALQLFVEMHGEECLRPDDLTLVSVFGACARLLDVSVGIQGHGWMVKNGHGSSVKACNALMDMYVKKGLMSKARRVFEEMREPSLVSWTVMLGGVIRWEGLENARLMFDRMQEKSEITWTKMVAAYVESGYTPEAFQLLREMIFDFHLELNHAMLCSILGASAQSGDVMMGKWVHVYALKAMEKDMDVMVGTALLDMYAKCGRIRSALNVFERMSWRNVVSWNAIISGLAMHGRGEDALSMFPRMLKEAKPDDLTFTSILNACSHSGLVDEGRWYFHALQYEYGITPKIEHYACMVDLLGRAGQVEEAEMIVKTMPMPPNEVVLGSLLGSCHVHRKPHLAERILKQLVEFDPHNTENHVLLSNLYTLEGKSVEANALRQALKSKGIKKAPGISFIHVNGQFHQFCAGDNSHPQTREIYNMLKGMIDRKG